MWACHHVTSLDRFLHTLSECSTCSAELRTRIQRDTVHPYDVYAHWGRRTEGQLTGVPMIWCSGDA